MEDIGFKINHNFEDFFLISNITKLLELELKLLKNNYTKKLKLDSIFQLILRSICNT